MYKPYITVHHSTDTVERIGYVFIDSISAITFAEGHTYIILNDGNLEVNETPEDILQQISDITNIID